MHLHDLQQSCRVKKRKVPETVAVAFGLAEKFILGGGSADNPNGSDVNAGLLCELEEGLFEERKEVEEWCKKVRELEKSQQEADRIRDDAVTTLRNECEAANKERVEAAKEREELAKVRAKAFEIS